MSRVHIVGAHVSGQDKETFRQSSDQFVLTLPVGRDLLQAFSAAAGVVAMLDCCCFSPNEK